MSFKMSPKMKISQILEKKKREDPIGLITAQREGTLAQFMAVELRAAGINPDAVVFGGPSPASSNFSSPVAKTPAQSPVPSPVPAPVARQPAPAPAPVIVSAPAPAPVREPAPAPVREPAPAPASSYNSYTNNYQPPAKEPIRHLGGSSNKCPVCSKSVFKMEEIVAMGSSWHKQCFKCGGTGDQGCRRALTKDQAEQLNGQPYCNGCFSKINKAPKTNGRASEPPVATQEQHIPEPVAVVEEPKIQPISERMNNFRSAPSPAPAPAPLSYSDSLPSDFYGQGQKKSSAADRFRAPIGGGSNKCPKCTKSVFKMEEVFALNSSWHKQCFTCGGVHGTGCGRVLTQDAFENISGQPLCRACFASQTKAAISKTKVAVEVATESSESSFNDISAHAPVREPSPAPIIREPSPAPVIREPSPAPVREPSPAPYVPEPVVVERVPEPVREVVRAPAPAPAPVYNPKPANDFYNYSAGPGASTFEKPKSNVASKFGAAGNKCPVCTKTVYKAEELVALNSFWHPTCFTCGGTGSEGCKRRLTKQDFHAREGAPFCNACFDRLVKAAQQKASVVVPATTVSAPAPAPTPIVEPIVEVEVDNSVKEISHVVSDHEQPKAGILSERASAFKGTSSTVNNYAYTNSSQNEPKPVSGRSSAAADKFSKFGAAGNKCPICTKTVYKAEELVALNSFWHPTCFTCGGTGELGCKRRLTKQDFHAREGAPYCNACFDRLVKAAQQKTSVALNQQTINSPRNPDETEASAPVPAPITHVAETSAPWMTQSEETVLKPRSELPKCHVCSKNVYKLEELNALGTSWHKQCFTCGSNTGKGCDRLLTLDSFVEKDNIPFCANCASKVEVPAPAPAPVFESAPVPAPAPISAPLSDDSSYVKVEQFETANTTNQSEYIEVSKEDVQSISNVDQLDIEVADDKIVIDEIEIGEIVITDEAIIPPEVGTSEEATADEEGVTFTDVEFKGSIYRGFHLSYGYDFDENGVVHWIGTRGKTTAWENPHNIGLLVASMSSVYKGNVSNVVARTIEKSPNYTDNALNSWIKIDLGPNRLLLADHYTIRHGGSSKGNALRNWTLQAKAEEDVDDDGWVTLREHHKDDSLSDEADSAASWELDIPEEISDSSTIGFRYFRLVQHGPNSNGNNCLFCCGLEFYGVLFDKLP